MAFLFAPMSDGDSVVSQTINCEFGIAPAPTRSGQFTRRSYLSNPELRPSGLRKISSVNCRRDSVATRLDRSTVRRQKQGVFVATEAAKICPKIPKQGPWGAASRRRPPDLFFRPKASIEKTPYRPKTLLHKTLKKHQNPDYVRDSSLVFDEHLGSPSVLSSR